MARDGVTLQVALAGGMARNNEVGGLRGSSPQYYAQGIVNAGIAGRAALGRVPTYVANPPVRLDGEDGAFSLGIHGQVYLTEQLSIVGEWAVTEERPTLPRDPGASSIELETGRHFLRVSVTNSLRLNPAQHFAGAAHPWTADELRLAFNITRVLAFKTGVRIPVKGESHLVFASLRGGGVASRRTSPAGPAPRARRVECSFLHGGIDDRPPDSTRSGGIDSGVAYQRPSTGRIPAEFHLRRGIRVHGPRNR